MNKTIMHHSYNTDFTVINQDVNDMEVVDSEVVDSKELWKQEFDSIKNLFPLFVVKYYCGTFSAYAKVRQANSFEAMLSLFEDYQYEQSLF